MNTKVEDFPRHKRDEVAAVKRFLENQGIPFDFSLANIDVDADEPTDVWVKDIDMRFQIVESNFDVLEGVGKAQPDARGSKSFEWTRIGIESETEAVISSPLRKKSKYGASARGIILLINVRFQISPTLERDIAKSRTVGDQKKLKTHGFDEIFLVLRYKNIQLYP